MLIGKKLEQWENARIEGIVSKGLLIALVFCNVYLATKIAKTNNRVIIAPPVIEKRFWIDEASASKEYLLEMGEYFVAYVLTATPKSIDRKINNFERYIDPTSFGVIKNELALMSKKFKDNNISQAFLSDNAELKKQMVLVSGTLKKYVGEVETISEKKSYEIGFKVKNGEIYVKSFKSL